MVRELGDLTADTAGADRKDEFIDADTLGLGEETAAVSAAATFVSEAERLELKAICAPFDPAHSAPQPNATTASAANICLEVMGLNSSSILEIYSHAFIRASGSI